MPNPRRRHSRARGRRRRTHWKIEPVALVACPKCKSQKISHRICPVCGYYSGRLVIDFEAKKAVKEQRRKKRGQAHG